MDKTPQQEQAITPAPETAAAADAAAQPDAVKKPEFVTKGQKIHKLLAYGGIDFVLNFSFGTAFTLLTKRTKTGVKLWSEPVEKLCTVVLPGKLKGGAGYLKDVISIIVGGMVIIPPLQWAEKHENRRATAKFFDKMIYGKDKVENDPKFQQAYDDIDKEPTKDFKTGLISRFIALAPCIYVSYNASHHEWLSKHYYSKIGTLSLKAAEKIGLTAETIRPRKWWNTKAFEPALKKETSNWEQLHNILGFDTGLTLPYAGMHAVAYNFVARLMNRSPREEKKQAAEKQTETTAMPVIAAAAPPEVKPPASREEIPQPSHAAREVARKIETETAAPVIGA